MPTTQAWKDANLNTARGTALAAWTPFASFSKTKPDWVNSTVTEPAYSGFVRTAVTFAAPSTLSGTTRRTASSAVTTFPAKATGADEHVGYACLFTAASVGVLYDANPLPDTGSALTITAASNAGPIVITSTAHGLATGMFVRVSGVVGNTNANGEWQITVVDANSFSLLGATGNAAYVSGGIAQRFGFQIINGTTPNIPSGNFTRDSSD